jgi:hypothetical protein
MGTALPLKSSSDSPGQSGRKWKEEDIPEAKGRLLIFRGCAESAGAGQPEIITLKGLTTEQRRQVLTGLKQLATATGFAGTSGLWPSGEEAPVVPPQASLVGNHVVASNYAPEIRFQVESSHDFLAPVALTTTAAGGAQRLSWQTIPTALGYQAIATGMGREEGDIVMWTSSEAPWADSTVPGDLRAPAATRLVQRGVLLAPERTTCSVSAQAMAAMRTAMVTFTAYGDTLLLNSAKGAPAPESHAHAQHAPAKPANRSSRKSPAPAKAHKSSHVKAGEVHRLSPSVATASNGHAPRTASLPLPGEEDFKDF